MKKQIMIIGILAGLIQGCTGYQAQISEAEKQSTVSQSVFSSSGSSQGNELNVPVNGDSSLGLNIPASGGGSSAVTVPVSSPPSPHVTPPPPPPTGMGSSVVPTSAPAVLDLVFRCSSAFVNAAGYSLVSVNSVLVQLIKSDNPSVSVNPQVLCEYMDSSLPASILSTKKLDLGSISANLNSHCPTLHDGSSYILNITRDDQAPPISQTGVTRVSGQLVPAFPGTQPRIVIDGQYTRQRPDIPCDELTSPLVIKYDGGTRDSGPLNLTSQIQGVFFDILGETSAPVPHTPKRISWIRSTQYLFIALPDANGKVNGINELFGDNTLGPDGGFAANGYAALAKYDGMSADGKTRLKPADGYIDESDAVFAKLRVWQDENRDGIAQASELHPLSDFGIRTIDLNYNPNFREVDRYGNETRYKSVVQTSDGHLHLLFDIWFKYLD